ncbi:MAG TPA: mechanosensitive ion channel family protein [Fibrobacteraceae bacterium]|nr:mechanosensitive ion channel family protein [Fibrobacteraceae bacterium]
MNPVMELDKVRHHNPFLFADSTGWQMFGNPLSSWLFAALVVVVSWLILHTTYRLVSARMRTLAARTTNRLDDVAADTFAQTRAWFLVALAFYGASWFLSFGSYARHVGQIMGVLFWLQSGFWGMGLLQSALRQWHESRGGDKSTMAAMVAISFLGKLLVWSGVLLLVLDNLGVKVVSLLAGLGVGGIAVALAVQRVLGDLLASVSIVLDKPFEIGDFIVVGTQMGTVEHVGLKTTRLRSLSGEQVVISNGDLLDSRIHNFKRMQERRIVLSIGVTYQTDAAKVAKVPQWLQEIFSAVPHVRMERAHLQRFGDSAIVFEAVYWVDSPEYNVYMDAQQAVLLQILTKFQTEGVDFAYPTQTVFVQKSC